MTDKIPLSSHLTDKIKSLVEQKEERSLNINEQLDPLYVACYHVASTLGIDFPAYNFFQDPISLDQLADKTPFRYRRVILSNVWWTTDNGPFIGFDKETNQPCALIPKQYGGYELFDYASRKMITVTPEMAAQLAHEGIYLYRPFPNIPLTLKTLLQFIWQSLKIDYWRVFIFTLLAMIFGLLVPVASGKLFGEIIPNAEKDQLLQWFLILLMNGVIISAFNLSLALALLRVRLKANVSLESALWDRVLHLPVPFFRKYSVGDLAMRSAGMDVIQQTITGTTLTSIINGLFIPIPLLVMFYYDYVLASAVTAMTIIALSIYGMAFLFQVRYQRQLLTRQGELAGSEYQLLKGISKVRTASGEERMFSMWADQFIKSITIFYRSGKLVKKYIVFSAMINLIAMMIIFALASWRGTELSLGDFIAFNATYGIFYAALYNMTQALFSSIIVIPLYERAKPILLTLPEKTNTGIEPGELAGNVSLKQASFYYQPDKYILQNVSLDIAKGQFVAIVGPSGAGKSTLIRLLLGFDFPQSGSIFYDEHDLATLNVLAVRRQIGMVLQQDSLLPGTILENICCASTLSEHEAWEAAKLVALDQDIQQMPMGMQTIVMEGGKTLSVGQRQRLMIARALAHHPRVLILDEATSALDNTTQRIVHNNLANQQITRIVIAQRLSTISDADWIYVLDQGHIVQQGKFDQLVSESGLFSELAKRQLL